LPPEPPDHAFELLPMPLRSRRKRNDVTSNEVALMKN
jgi:hypothetical protein